MKIVCERCNNSLGEQVPYNDLSEIKAKCQDCIKKEKEEAYRFHPLPKVGERLKVLLGKGAEGTIWVATTEQETLSAWELAVSGRRFYCSEVTRKEFQQYLAGIDDEEPEATFLYSMSIPIKSSARVRKGSRGPSKQEGESIKYNCTVKLLKHYIYKIFDEKADRINKFLDVIVNATYNAYKEDLRVGKTIDAESTKS